jgi:hypothetical protein
LGSKEIRTSRDVNSENESKSREKGEPKNSAGTFFERGVRNMGPWMMKAATAVLAVQAVGASGLEGRSLMSESSALAPRGGKELTDRTSSSLVASEQRANFIEGLPERKLSQDTAGPSDPDGTNKNLGVPDEDSPLRKLWPHLAEDIDKWAREGKQASKDLHQGEAQGKDERETALDFRSRKVTPSGETARSAMDVPSSQRGQDKSKGVEDLELSKEEIESLKSFNASLNERPKALKGFRKLSNNKKFMEAVNDLKQDKEFRERALSELKNEESVRKAISLLENSPAASDACVTWYRAYKSWDHTTYNECCKDAVGTPHCDNTTRYDVKNVMIWTAGTVAVCIGLLCCSACTCPEALAEAARQDS